ncbi:MULTISPECIES: right-handed parallel beta-helix repeat-containing protein [Chromohalobacter]|uniref:Right-handed parallel beta-helix repeat-containing protein n=1 Tax=Chromohalobacter moromii TaxID=2860329 RepID=A0A9X2X4C7_9GAMM|nr:MULTISPECIES: right-handed parallel beta-helix repeat-containing protein [Chromohalobacter]MCK2047141.1 right-handed parallel beta-helix repeat-containing protein [Chromohalobacter moromii]MCT8468081.1 right-handed parallel beta-helix repeat-containing protein [Chromohalobacter canadensis]MCT8498580.1 right-handed parallel beta-helix repeat-containing protein [Chromohalobacter canadensis]MCT8506824.1 right-handed parallel beta-helix repeat-containing protein [Chromohalobacter moromii]
MARLLQGGAVLTASGLLPTHAAGMEKRDKEGKTTQEGAETLHADSIAEMQALDVTRLQDGQRIQVAGYHAGESLGGGSFIWYAHERREEDGGTCFRAHDQADGRFLRRLDDTLTPGMFGARGDGSDQYLALKQLAKAANAQQRDIVFPEGDFASSGTGLRFTGIRVTGAGVTRTTLRYTSDTYGAFVAIHDGATLSGMTLDGNVSDDPARWSTANHDAFTGALPLDLLGHDVTAHDLVCRRSPRSCLRVGARNFVLRDVVAEHARGNYGDGIFIADSRDGIVERCQARDFTRIGFVTDTYGESPRNILSERIDFIDCLAENGHHASVDYGDDEYNAGFWAENSNDVRFINCRSRDTTHHGFVATTGRTPSQGTGHFTLRGCIAETTGDGYLLSDLNDTPVRHTVDDCLARDVARGFCIEMSLAASRLTGQRFTTLLGDSRRTGNTLSFTGDGHIDIRDIDETWQTFYPRRYESIRARYASVVAAGNFKGELHLAHFQSRHGDTDEPIAVGFKLIDQSHLRNFTLSATRARLFHVPAERISLHDCEISAGWVKAFETLDVDACRLGDGVPRFDIFDTTQHHRYRHCQFDFTPGGGHLYLHNSDKRNARHVVRFERCRFKKDLAQHGYMITLEAAPGVFMANESNYLTFRDCTFENTGQATDTPAIRTLQRPPQASLTGYGNRKNDAIGTLTAFELDDDLMADG